MSGDDQVTCRLCGWEGTCACALGDLGVHGTHCDAASHAAYTCDWGVNG